MLYKDLPESVNSLREIEEIIETNKNVIREVFRIYVNEISEEPASFGIYQDGEEWSVYKNNYRRQRVILYHGISETYAAQEIWDKILEINDYLISPNQNNSISELIEITDIKKVNDTERMGLRERLEFGWKRVFFILRNFFLG